MFARIRTARSELESQHRHSHGPAGQRDRRQHARRALFGTGRRTGSRTRLSDPLPAAGRKRGFHPGIGQENRRLGIHPALPAMYRHDRSDRRRDRLALGLYFGTLQYGFGMDNGLSDVSPFLLVII